jgi:hypothetical protein
LALSETFRGSIPGWFSLLGVAETSEENPNMVRFKDSNDGCLPSFLTQTISAEKLRGKRVRLTAELDCDPDALARSGLVLWGSKQDGRSTAFASISADGTSSLATITNHDTHESHGRNDRRTIPLSLELDLDDTSDVLSLGIYAKQTEVHISKVRLEVNPTLVRREPASDPITPLNLLQVPFVPVHPEPRNLDFSEPASSDSGKVPSIAEQENGTLRK